MMTHLDRRPDEPELKPLERQYREIGISAVAAALPYQGEPKNPAYARTESAAPHYPDEAA